MAKSQKRKPKRAGKAGKRAGKAKKAGAKFKPPKFITRIIDVLFKDEVTPNRSDDEDAAGGSESPGGGGGETKPVKPAVLTEDVKGWRVANSLNRLLEQVNQMAPGRRKASDGSIGDVSHQKRNSDHNPWVIDGKTGVVTARDITDDVKGGCSAQAIADAIVAAKDRRVKYVIWNRKIVSSAKQPWVWRPYSGSNPHTKHIHVSVLPDKGLYDDVTDWSLTAAEVAKVKTDFGVDTVGAMQIAWGRKVAPSFKEKVVAICAGLGVDPNFLMAAMAFESARTFSPSIQNPASKATGLIQFMPSTAAGMGTSISALAKMSALEQLDWVEAYFKPHSGKLRDLDDVYMAILWPKAVGKPASFVLFAQPTKQYAQNRGLDANDDGTVTKAEAASRVQQHLVEGMREEFRG
jgi:hypothetical protein